MIDDMMNIAKGLRILRTRAMNHRVGVWMPQEWLCAGYGITENHLTEKQCAELKSLNWTFFKESSVWIYALSDLGDTADIDPHGTDFEGI